jgi:alkylation response protein AidB-like acyl-CoA dehydrogenase
MDLAFTPEEQQFREDIRAWVKDNLPADISHKVHNALRLSRDDMQRWGKILGKKGWLGHGWPKQFGGPAGTPCKSTCSKKSARWPGPPASCPSAPSWWPR